MKEDARLTDSLSHPSRWWWSHPSLPLSPFFFHLAPLFPSFLLRCSILYPVLACQPFILYQDESVRVGPNIKGDGSPLARDRGTEIPRSDDGSGLSSSEDGTAKSSGRILRGTLVQPCNLSPVSWYVDSLGSLLDYWLCIVREYARSGAKRDFQVSFDQATASTIYSLSLTFWKSN